MIPPIREPNGGDPGYYRGPGGRVGGLFTLSDFLLLFAFLCVILSLEVFFMAYIHDNYYRLNVHLPLELGERLCSFCDTTGLTKVAVVSAALDSYLATAMAARQMVERLSDPMVMAAVVSSLSPDLLSQLGLSAADESAAEESAEG